MTQRNLALLSGLKEALHAAKNNEALLYKTAINNPWFTTNFSQQAITAHINSLEESLVMKWLSLESQWLDATIKPKKIGLILAGNLPLVGLHDVVCTLISGHTALVKLSSSDAVLCKWVLEKWVEINTELRSKLVFVEGLMKEVDAFIGTGSNNSARYFSYYFQNKPHLIRKNRNSVAIIDNNTSKEQFEALGNDVFGFFGMGCRNVTHLYLPPNFDFGPLFEAFEIHKECIHHHKYANNYTYHKAILLMNLDKHLDTGFMMCKESERIASPVSMLHYSYYEEESSLINKLAMHAEEIQCVATGNPLLKIPGVQTVTFGSTQEPALWDYADGINTLAFLHKAGQDFA
jgi:hypothetical protein